MSKVYCDYLGFEFSSIREMAELWNINYATLQRRLYTGMSVYDAITKPIVSGKCQGASIENCLNCQCDDCKNSRPMTKEETEVVKMALEVKNGT